MDVSMDGIRLELISNYNDLIWKLNSAIDDDNEIKIDSKEIRDNLEGIRMMCGILANVKVDGEFDFIKDYHLDRLYDNNEIDD